MKEKEFYPLGIAAGIVSMILSIIMMPVESIGVGIISLILNIRQRKQSRIIIGLVITALAFIFSAGAIIIFIITANQYGEITTSNYWFFNLFS